jgi:hypothetical protein
VTRAASALAGLLAWGLVSCGYQPAHEVLAGPAGGFSVAAAPARVADAQVIEGAVLGARLALSRMGLLGEQVFPRLRVEVLRLDESSGGIRSGTLASADAGPELAGGRAPLARGTTLTLVGRAHVEPSDGAAPAAETGEISVSAVFAAEGDARLDALRRDDMSRELGLRLGMELAGRILGYPTPRGEGMWYRPSP